jgi:prepilin-type N-terminal cleavage/methylation domain-containing protein
MSSRISTRGFSLIEVMVAVVILTISLVGILSAASLVQSGAGFLTETSGIQNFLEQHAQVVALQTILPASPITSNPTNPSALGGTLVDTYTATAVSGVYSITSTISYTDAHSQPASYSLHFLAHFPQ